VPSRLRVRGSCGQAELLAVVARQDVGAVPHQAGDPAQFGVGIDGRGAGLAPFDYLNEGFAEVPE
jgi:hypothetical protein